MGLRDGPSGDCLVSAEQFIREVYDASYRRLVVQMLALYMDDGSLNLVVAGSVSGELLMSSDGGRTWTATPDR